MQEEPELVEPVVFHGNLMDSKTSHLDDLLIQKLEEAFHHATSTVLVHDVAKVASEHDPIDLAYAVKRLPPNSRHIVYENLPDFHAKVIFMINTDSTTRAAIFRVTDDKEIRRLIEKMPLDEAVWMLDDLSDRRLKRVIDLLDAKKAARIRDLLRADRNSAARLMTNEFFAFHFNATIGEVAKAIRENPGIDLTRRVFVLNDEGLLVGYVPGRNLIINPDYVPLKQVMRPVLHTVSPETLRDEVCDLVERYKIAALPVLDSTGTMAGVITYEVVVEAMEDIADETIANIVGTAEEVGEDEPVLRRVLARAPWLLVTLCSGMATMAAMHHFENSIWFIGLVPFFVPLIAGMSGNVGLQTSTLLVRGMTTGELSSGTKYEAVGKELKIGLTIGSFFGFVAGLAVWGLNLLGVHYLGLSPGAAGLTVGMGVFTACFTATALGTFFPLLFIRLGVDPAVASGPFITAFNDVSSTLMFFFIAWLVHGLA